MKTQILTTATVAVVLNFVAIADTLASNDGDYSFMIGADWHNCQQIGTDYQEVFAFETNSFYINICQKGNAYFYSGEAKQSNLSSIFIPAQPLEDNRGFRAENGNLSYLVLLPFSQNQLSQNRIDSTEPAEVVLTIKRNGQLATVESSINKYCHSLENRVSHQVSQTKNAMIALGTMRLQNYSQLATLPQADNFSPDLFFIGQEKLLAPKVFESGSRFDFYRVGGELHRLATCN